jgi:MFS family permease
MITSSVNVASTFPDLYLVEKWGRRNLLLFGAVGMAVCQFIVAITGTVVGIDDQSAQKALITFVCIYIFFFACSWGPVAWVVTGEIVMGGKRPANEYAFVLYTEEERQRKKVVLRVQLAS